MAGMEKLILMKDKDVQEWLIKVDAGKKVKTLITALTGAGDDVVEKVVANMSPKAGAALKAGIKECQKRKVKDSEIKAAVGVLERMI